jgi:kinetochore protein Nuf2
MSALLNFAKFREEQIKVYAELTEPRSHVLVKLEEVQEENVQLNAYLEEVQAQARQQLQELEEIMAECENLEVEIAESNKLQAAARQENVALNKQAKELKDQVDAAVWALQEAEAEEEGLRVKLVNSPDRYKQELFYKTEQLAKVKQECAELDRQIEQLKTKMARALQSLNELEQINRDLDEVLKLEKSYRAKLAQIEETKHRGEALQKRHNELRQSVDQVERQIARHEEKITAQRKQHELEMHGLSEALDLAKSRLLRVEKERRDAMSRIEAGEAEVRQIESLIAMEKQKTESEIHQWIAEYEVVEEAFLQKNEKRMAVLREQMNQGFPELETPAVQ